jgi:hypothetical protein
MTMIRTIVRVARGEGVRSVTVRTAERVSEAWQRRVQLARGALVPRPRPELVNLLTMPRSARLGGVVVQLNARLEEEARLREVALFHDGVLEIGSRAWPARSLEALGARTLIVEGAFGDLPALPQELILVIHDFSLLSPEPHELEVDDVRCKAAGQLLRRARAAIFPSAFLRDAYRAVVPRFEGHVIEPGIAEAAVRAEPVRNRIAFAGSVKPHKGGALIPAIIRATGAVEWHLFGGGEAELLCAVRALPDVAVHG